MHKDFNTEGKDAKFGVKFKLRNGNTVTFWFATKEKQQKEINNWKSRVGKPGETYTSVSPVKR